MIDEIEKNQDQGRENYQKFYTGLLTEPHSAFSDPLKSSFLLFVGLKLTCRYRDTVPLNFLVWYELTIFYFVTSPRNPAYF